MSNFIKNPTSIEDLKGNVEFQMSCLKGWLSVNNYETALIKAKCLVEALQDVVNAKEADLSCNPGNQG